jgi:methylglutaconyl-CoA hydratase
LYEFSVLTLICQVPAIISAYVVHDLGQFHAKQFFLTGEKITAQKALEVGFLTEVAEDEAELGKLVQVRLDLTMKDKLTAKYVDMLLKSGPNAMTVVKEAVRHHVDHPHAENLAYVTQLFASGLVTGSEEALYGIGCFVSKKEPNWTEFYEKKAKL